MFSPIKSTLRVMHLFHNHQLTMDLLIKPSSILSFLIIFINFLLSKYSDLFVLLRLSVNKNKNNLTFSLNSSSSSSASISSTQLDGGDSLPIEMLRRLHEDNEHYCHFQLDDSTIQNYHNRVNFFVLDYFYFDYYHFIKL